MKRMVTACRRSQTRLLCLLVFLLCLLPLAACSAAGSLSSAPPTVAAGRSIQPATATREPSPAASSSTPVSTPTSLPPTQTPIPTATKVAATPTPAPTKIVPTPTPKESVSPPGFVPILMYHHIAPPNPKDDAIRRGLTVSPEELEAQLAWLAANNYHTVSMEQLFHHLVNGAPLAPRSLILTFDDGYRDNYVYAYPLLQKYGFHGIFFIVTDLVGLPEYLTWDMIRTMRDGGNEIGAHTLNHPALSALSKDAAWQQIDGSKQKLEEELGQKILFFDYPSGDFTERVKEQVKEAGYAAAVSTIPGNVNNFDTLYELRRIRIIPGIDLKHYIAPLQTPYLNK